MFVHFVTMLLMFVFVRCVCFLSNCLYVSTPSRKSQYFLCLFFAKSAISYYFNVNSLLSPLSFPHRTFTLCTSSKTRLSPLLFLRQVSNFTLSYLFSQINGKDGKSAKSPNLYNLYKFYKIIQKITEVKKAINLTNLYNLYRFCKIIPRQISDEV